MCKHNPCRNKHIIQRAYKFLFDKSSLIDRKSWTGTCSQCGKLIDAPNLSAYWFVMFLGLGIYRGALHIVLKLLKLNFLGLDLMLVGAYLVLFVWFVPSLLLAFGKWKEAPKGILSESEYVTNKANDLARSRRTPRFRLNTRGQHKGTDNTRGRFFCVTQGDGSSVLTEWHEAAIIAVRR